MIELARFCWRGRWWALALGTDRQPRLLCSAPDRRIFTLVREGEVGRAIPADETTLAAYERADGNPVPIPPRDVPWLGWSFAIVCLGEDERRLLWYRPWDVDAGRRRPEVQEPSGAPGDLDPPSPDATRGRAGR